MPKYASAEIKLVGPLQVLLGFSCNCKADIFSFGVLMWELATGEMPSGRCLRPLRYAINLISLGRQKCLLEAQTMQLVFPILLPEMTVLASVLLSNTWMFS